LRDRWRLTPEELENICCDDPQRPRILILNYPNNPSGSTYRQEELKAIAAVARKYSVILLSDEIYGELHHTGQHISIARFYPEGTIISSGLSKWCGAGGWRLGTFTFPKSLYWLLDAMAVVASETYTATSAPIQYAAVRAFQGGPEIEDYLAKSRRVLRVLGRYISKRLHDAGLLLPEPKGGFYLYPDFSPFADRLRKKGISTSQQMCERLLEETGVAILPGSFFGARSEELSARLAYVDFDGAKALAALNGVDSKTSPQEFISTNAKPIKQAVDALCNWLD